VACTANAWAATSVNAIEAGAENSATEVSHDQVGPVATQLVEFRQDGRQYCQRQSAEIKTSPTQSNLGRARRHPSRRTPQIRFQNCPFSFDDRHAPPSITAIPRPTPLITRNGIRNQSAVLPQYTSQTDSQTDRQTDPLDRRQVSKKSAHAVLY